MKVCLPLKGVRMDRNEKQLSQPHFGGENEVGGAREKGKAGLCLETLSLPTMGQRLWKTGFCWRNDLATGAKKGQSNLPQKSDHCRHCEKKNPDFLIKFPLGLATQGGTLRWVVVVSGLLP